jgi:hypothetical protein
VLDQSTACLANNCTGSLLPLFTKAQGCFDCIVYYLTSLQPISSAQSACTTSRQPPFAFGGQTPAMILSRYRFASDGAKNASYILPSSGFRRAVLKVQVVIDEFENQTLDFFCAQLSSPGLDAVLPYTGYYGPMWQDEQHLQAAEAIAWIKQEADADGVPAIIAGDWQASVAYSNGDASVQAQSPEVIGKLDQAFARADPPKYVPTCDSCPPPTNVYNATTQTPYEFTKNYLYDPPTSASKFGQNATQAESLWGTDNVLPITGTQFEPPPPGMKGPLSPQFPRNIQVLRPAAGRR